MNSPAITFVVTLPKAIWLKPGARKPVLAAARNVTRSDGWKRSATLPVIRSPKSL